MTLTGVAGCKTGRGEEDLFNRQSNATHEGRAVERIEVLNTACVNNRVMLGTTLNGSNLGQELA